MNVTRILFPTDFSDSSEAALNCASSLAAENNAELAIVHVGSDSTAYLAGYGGFGSAPDLSDRVERENRKLLDQVKPTVANVKFSRHYLSGSPDTEILAFAEREKMDLIVIGSHGRTGLSRLLLGSVAEAVVRCATCPVLTVKHLAGEVRASEKSPAHEHAPHPVPMTKHSLH